MARFYPDVDSSTLPYQSERLVYEALRGLDDDHHVLHSFPWLRPERDLDGTPLREGEADFVILHPRHGLLVLEVKGGEPVLENRGWRRGGRPMKDPFTQAARNMHALLDALEGGGQGGISRRSLTHGYAVVFPNCRYQGELPLHADKAVVLDARHLADFPRHIDRAARAWGDGPRLDGETLKRVRATLMPTLRLVQCVAPSFGQADAQIVQLTEAQHATLTGLFESPRVLVEGVAGSGKTLLALEAAIARAGRGESVRLLCYNHQLAEWLKERLVGEARVHSGTVQVDTFHGLALRVAREARVELPTTLEPEFWERDAAAALDQAISLLRGTPRDPTCDALVIDEAQDFREEWWSALIEILRDPFGSPLYAFMDLDQALWATATPPPPELFPVRYPLRTNCRNSQSICLTSAAFASRPSTPLPGMPEGPPVRHRRARSIDEQVAMVTTVVTDLIEKDGLRPGQIALISPASHANGPLAGAPKVGRFPVETDACVWRRGEALLSTTARAFKGLEADVVVLHGLHELSEVFTQRDLYVAWTRAKHLLVVISERGQVQRAVDAAVQIGSGR